MIIFSNNIYQILSRLHSGFGAVAAQNLVFPTDFDCCPNNSVKVKSHVKATYSS